MCAAQRDGMTLISVVLKGASGQTAPDAASILNYGFDQFQLLSLGDSDFSIISGGDVVVPNGTAEDSLTTEDTQNGDEIDRTYLFNGAAVGSAVLEVTQAQDTASVQEGEQNMQAAREYSEAHTYIPLAVPLSAAFPARWSEKFSGAASAPRRLPRSECEHPSALKNRLPDGLSDVRHVHRPACNAGRRQFARHRGRCRIHSCFQSRPALGARQ